MRKIFAVILLILTLLATDDAVAQSTRRKSLKPTTVAPSDTTMSASGIVTTDTIRDVDRIKAVMRLSDFKKSVASRVETLMISNLSECDTIQSVTVDIDYRTTDGKQLNRRTVTFTVSVPPGETRHASVQSWDRQQLFYYRKTPPTRLTQRTTAFDVTLTPLSIVVKPTEHIKP